MIGKAGFDFVRNLAAQRAGIRFEPGSEYLLEARLLPLARLYKAGSVNEFIRMMQNGAIRDSEQSLIEVLADKETSFFRDVRPFDHLRKSILPELVTRRNASRTLSFWCIGCSTGQEPYSIALMLREYFPDLLSWDVEILASDISAEAIHAAQAGLYNQIEVNRGLPVALLVKHFQKDSLSWRLKEEVRRMVQFHQMNVFQPWPAVRKFDVIFLRNVMSQFVPDAQTDLLRKIRRRLHPDGFMFLGGKESPPGIADHFEELKTDKAVCYRPKATGDDTEDSDEDRERKLRDLGPWAVLAHLAMSKRGIDLDGFKSLLAENENLKTRFREVVLRELGEKKLTDAMEAEAVTRVRREQLFATACTDLIAKAINESFQSMLPEGVTPADPAQFDAQAQEEVASVAKFSGPLSGKLAVRFRPDLAKDLTVEALGISTDDVTLEVINDFIGQVVNLISNTVNASFGTAELKCKLETAEVTRGKRAQTPLPGKAALMPLVFLYNNRHPVWVDILVTAVE